MVIKDDKLNKLSKEKYNIILRLEEIERELKERRKIVLSPKSSDNLVGKSLRRSKSSQNKGSRRKKK